MRATGRWSASWLIPSHGRGEMRKIAWASLVLMFVIAVRYDLESLLLKIEAATESCSVKIVQLVPIEDVADHVQLDFAFQDEFIVLRHQHYLARLPERFGQTSGQNIVLDL